MQHKTRQQTLQLQHRASGRERLSMLATFLEDLPPGRLTLGCWFRNGRGCAVGLAASAEPWFQAQGLRLQDMTEPARCHPVYREFSDWNAVAAFFDLDFEQCRALFAAGAYEGNLEPSPLMLAQRIRGLLEIRGTADSGGENIPAGPSA